MSNLRKLTFGKYKGQPILLIVAEHIGYIMWCLENLKWFKLNEEEQRFYDYQAIAIKKYGVRMIFPVETMYKHVKDKEALEHLDTPYQFINGEPYMPKENDLFPLLKECGAVRKKDKSVPLPSYDKDGKPWWWNLQQGVTKDIEWMSDEDMAMMDDYGVRLPMGF